MLNFQGHVSSELDQTSVADFPHEWANLASSVLQSPVQSIRGKNLDFSRSTIPTVSRYEKCGVFPYHHTMPYLVASAHLHHLHLDLP